MPPGKSEPSNAKSAMRAMAMDRSGISCRLVTPANARGGRAAMWRPPSTSVVRLGLGQLNAAPLTLTSVEF